MQNPQEDANRLELDAESTAADGVSGAEESDGGTRTRRRPVRVQTATDETDVSGAEEGLDAETPDASIPTEDSNTSDEEEDTTDSGTEEDDSSIPVEDVSDNPVEDAASLCRLFPVEVEVVEWQVTPLSSGPIDVHTYLPQGEGPFLAGFCARISACRTKL